MPARQTDRTDRHRQGGAGAGVSWELARSPTGCLSASATAAWAPTGAQAHPGRVTSEPLSSLYAGAPTARRLGGGPGAKATVLTSVTAQERQAPDEWHQDAPHHTHAMCGISSSRLLSSSGMSLWKKEYRSRRSSSQPPTTPVTAWRTCVGQTPQAQLERTAPGAHVGTGAAAQPPPQSRSWPSLSSQVISGPERKGWVHGRRPSPSPLGSAPTLRTSPGKAKMSLQPPVWGPALWPESQQGTPFPRPRTRPGDQVTELRGRVPGVGWPRSERTPRRWERQRPGSCSARGEHAEPVTSRRPTDAAQRPAVRPRRPSTERL